MIPVNARTKRAHRPSLQVAWNVQVYDKDGRLTEEKSGRNSLLAGFAGKMAGFLCDAASTIKDINNVSRQVNAMNPASGATNQPNGIPCAGSPYQYGVITSGIVIGTNNTAVTADDYKLNTIVANGTGGGQLIYLAGASYGVVTAAPVSSFVIDRVVLNHSGGTITVKELGIYCLEGANATICLCRDIIADPGVDITDGSYMYVRYTISITT